MNSGYALIAGTSSGSIRHFSSSNPGKNPSVIKSTREVYRVILLCPECGARYDVGWRVSFTETEDRVIRTTGNQMTTV